MTASDIKFEILKKIDSLENNQLEEFHGLVLNFLNSQKEENEWNMSEEQRDGILSAISEIEQNKGISHRNVMSKVRSKFSHG